MSMRATKRAAEARAKGKPLREGGASFHTLVEAIASPIFIDTAARHGGDEFAVILPETAGVAARLVASRLCGRLPADSFGATSLREYRGGSVS